MSGDAPGAAAAYQHGGGYQPPKGGLTPRRIFAAMLAAALFLAAKWVLETYLGGRKAEDIFQLAVCAISIPWMIRAILLPEAPDYDMTAGEQRKAHIQGRAWMIAWLVTATVLATLSIQSLFFPG